MVMNNKEGKPKYFLILFHLESSQNIINKIDN